MYSTYLTLIVPALVAFAFTVAGVLFSMSYMREAGIIAIDHNKRGKPIVPTSGGVAVAMGFTLGLLAYVFGDSFGIYSARASTEYLFAAILSVILIAFVGFIDDINVQSKKVHTTGMKDIRKGLKQWQKPVLTFIGAVPLMAVNAGVSTVVIPFLGAVNLGVVYPLLILPLAVVFAANAFNLLGGFDGIASGSGLVACFGLAIYAVFFGTYTGAIVSSVLFAAILGFFIFDKYPARILCGDSFTYCVGAGIVSAAVIGNMEAFGVIVFAPWAIEFLLHLRAKFKSTDLGKLQHDGTFAAPYGRRIYSWTHAIMNVGRLTEQQVSMCMWGIEALFVMLGFAMKFSGLL